MIAVQGFSLDDDTRAAPADEKDGRSRTNTRTGTLVAAAPPPVAREPKPAAESILEPVAAAVATTIADNNNGAAPQPELFVAAKYSYGKVKACTLILFQLLVQKMCLMCSLYCNNFQIM